MLRKRPKLSQQTLLERYKCVGKPMLVFFTRRIYDGQLALDLVAETFARAFENRHRCKIDTEKDVDRWLWGIARHVLCDAIDRKVRERKATQRLGVQSILISESEQERIETLAGVEKLKSSLQEALLALSVQQRHAVELRVVACYSYSEIAENLGVSEEAARARVSRGLKVLAQAVDRLGLRDELAGVIE